MAAPEILNYEDPARTNDRIIGPLVVTVAIVAMWEVTRSVRWLNVLFGIWLIWAPFILGYNPLEALNSECVGLVMTGCALVRGGTKHRFAGGWSSLYKSGVAN